MKKIISFIFINLILIIFLLFVVELIIWFYENDKLRKSGVFPPSIQRLRFHPGIKMFKLDPETFPTPQTGWGRSPAGLEFNKKPIVIFGCSYAYGYNLRDEQTISYKLANFAKVPVYNRAWIGWSIQHMLYQSKLEKIYEQIPEPEYVIYVYIDDHIRRLYLLTFASWNILIDEQNLRYKEKNGQLIEIRNINPVLRQIKRLYIVNEIQHLLINKYLINPKNKHKSYDFALKHFTEAKSEMQKHWKNSKYIILFYNTENEYLQKKLEENDFVVINSSELTNEDLNTAQYMMKNTHPQETAWDLIVPALAKKLNL